jgi:choline-glycine betaine transporter
MKKSSYDYHAERQIKISNFNLAKTIMDNLGFVFTAITLIVFGITQIADSQDNTIAMALPVCIILTVVCFLSIVPVNNKLRELRTKKRYRVRNTLVNN